MEVGLEPGEGPRSFLGVPGIFTAMSVLCGKPTPGGACRRPVTVAGGPCGAEHPALAAVAGVSCGPPAVPHDPMAVVDADDSEWAGFGVDEDEAEEWAAAGFDPAAAADWRAAGFEYAADDARAWADAGVEPTRAWQWSMADIGPVEVSEWEAAGCSPGEAEAWQSHGIEAAFSASTWTDNGFTDPDEAGSWASVSGNFADPEVAAAWRDLGMDPEEASGWDWAGWSEVVTTSDLSDWVQARTRCSSRFEPDDLYEFDRDGLTPDDVVLLHDGPAAGRSGQWDRLAGHPSARVRSSAARADHLDDIDFERFAHPGEADEVRQAAAEHPDCPPSVLGRLAGDTDQWIRAVVARHPSTPPEVLAVLASDPVPDVREAVAFNRAAPAAARSHAGLLAD